MASLMGIDLGTTGVRVMVCDEEGAIRASATEEYPLSTPRPLWAEQDPGQWWQATAKAVNAVLKESGDKPVDAVGLTGQMHGAVLLDGKNEVLRPCILWCDQRTGKQCADIEQEVGRERLIELTCNPALTGFTAPKILWAREHEKAVFDRTERVLLPKDYIRYRLTGVFASDVSDASGTLLFDVRKRQWSGQMLSALRVDRSLLPEVFESTEVTGKVSAEGSAATGLPEGTPVVAGGGDQACGAVGSGIVEDGMVSVSMGTSGVVFTCTDRVKVEPEGRLHTFCHAVPGKWHLMGVMLAAGGSFRWLRDVVCEPEARESREKSVDAYEVMTAKAANAPSGSEGLIFLPYLSGERTPHADPDARGVFFGITLRHKREHLIRSVMEGICFGLRDSMELVRKTGAATEQVRVTGGGARSTLWRQILADVTGSPMNLLAVDEGPAFGASLLAGVGAGIFKDVESACSAAIRTTERIEPDSSSSRVYEQYYRVYRALYPLLKDSFREVAETRQ